MDQVPHSHGRRVTTANGRCAALFSSQSGLGVETPVICGTARTLRPLGELLVGDVVRTHTGKCAKVMSTSRSMRESKRVVLKGLQDFPLVAAAEHRFRTKQGRWSTQQEWRSLGEMRVGDVIGAPIPRIRMDPDRRIVWPFRQPDTPRPQGGGCRETGPDTVEPTYELGRMLGLFLAEGCVIKQAKPPHAVSAISFAVHEREAARAEAWLGALRPLFVSCRTERRRNSKTVTLTVYGRSFATFVRELCGELDNKRLPTRWHLCGFEYVRGLVHGYLSGDGHSESATRRITAPSVRSAIPIGMREALAALGYGWASVEFREGGVRHGRNERAQWTLRLCGPGVDELAGECGLGAPPERERNYRTSVKVMGRYAWIPILRIEDAGLHEVINLEIDHEEQSYCIVHGATQSSETAFGRAVMHTHDEN